MTYEPHITDAKRKEVEDVKNLFKQYSVAGVLNLEGLPTLMLQRIKKGLGDSVALKITKKRFMKIAIEELGKEVKNVEKLKDKLEGIPALLFTEKDPFLLYKEIDKNKASAAAKPGQKAPNDLSIEEGETPFTPGPMIGELGMLGIKTEVKDGKIHVKDPKVLVKEGEEVSDRVAGLLAKLGVEPMKVGLNLTHTLQKGEILNKSVLAIDEEEYLNNIKAAHSESFSLALHLSILNKETIKPLLSKAQRESLALADGADIMTSGNVGKLLAKAESEAGALNNKVPDVPTEEKPAEETKQEEPADEVKEQSAEEVAAEPETKEEPQPEPEVKEQPEEEPKQETPVEEKQEAPQEEPIQEEKPEEEQPQEEAPAEEPKEVKEEPEPEMPAEEKKEASAEEVQKQEENMKEIENISHKILGSGIKQKSSETEKKPENKSEEDINKLINTLKDKKSKGEI